MRYFWVYIVATGVLLGVTLSIVFPRHQQKMYCCRSDESDFGIAGIQPGNAQVAHAFVDNLPMCIQRHGRPQMIPLRDADGNILLVYEGCQ
jgi:hypothetical protein